MTTTITREGFKAKLDRGAGRGEDYDEPAVKEGGV